MALIKCPECNTEISSKATTCIKCGYPLSESEDANSGQVKQLNQADDNTLNSQKHYTDQNVGDDEIQCERCNGIAKLLPDRGRDYKWLVWAGLMIIFVPIIYGMLPESISDEYGGIISTFSFLLLIALIVFAFKKQDVFICQNCGHKHYAMIERN